MKALRDILNKTGGAVDKAYAEGVYVAGERFVVTTLADNRSVYARKVPAAFPPPLSSTHRDAPPDMLVARAGY